MHYESQLQIISLYLSCTEDRGNPHVLHLGSVEISQTTTAKTKKTSLLLRNNSEAEAEQGSEGKRRLDCVFMDDPFVAVGD